MYSIKLKKQKKKSKLKINKHWEERTMIYLFIEIDSQLLDTPLNLMTQPMPS